MVMVMVMMMMMITITFYDCCGYILLYVDWLAQSSGLRGYHCLFRDSGLKGILYGGLDPMVYVVLDIIKII